MDKKSSGGELSRRAFLTLSSAAAASLITGMPFTAEAAPGEGAGPKMKPKALRKKLNFLFLFTDQERHFAKMPGAFPLPGHDRLARTGTSFDAHHISSCMCTSSRSVMLTGLQTIDNGMYENVDMPYVKNMSTKIPTLGHMLRKAGYYTAYKGKWHLNREFDQKEAERLLTKEMEEYGFADFYSPGDAFAHELGGYNFDNLIAGSAVSWLRRKGRNLSDAGTPWSLTVSLVNPHDIMYFNADAPGENVQDTGNLLMHAARAPKNALYKNDWKYPLPTSLRQPLNGADRPEAHEEFHKAWGYCLGRIPLEDANWKRFTNFYLNSIRSVDAQVLNILTELDNLGLAENTVIVYTADHGEMGGAHGLRGKGPFAYREVLQVPFYVVHPDVKGGRRSKALTSHIDIVPTFLSMAGVEEKDIPKVAGRSLPGKDISPVLADPAGAPLHAVRDKALFTYSGLATNDSEMIRIVSEAKAKGENPKLALAKSRYLPNMKKRGTVRTVFDGRYKFSRYFSPLERNSPKTLEEIQKHNDIELFDLKNDPQEMRNLAVDAVTHGELILQMNAKLEAAIQAEMGADDGREMPNLPGIEWNIDSIDL